MKNNSGSSPFSSSGHSTLRSLLWSTTRHGPETLLAKQNESEQLLVVARLGWSTLAQLVCLVSWPSRSSTYCSSSLTPPTRRHTCLRSRRQVMFSGSGSLIGTSIVSSRVLTPTSTSTSSRKGRRRFGELSCFETSCGRTRPTVNSTLAQNET